jgi:hypothetical protein
MNRAECFRAVESRALDVLVDDVGFIEESWKFVLVYDVKYGGLGDLNETNANTSMNRLASNKQSIWILLYP